MIPQQGGLTTPYAIVRPAIESIGLYFFTTDSGIQYEVRFGRRQDNILYSTIVFGVINEEFDGEEYTLTNKGELYKVMSTIVAVVKIFMEKHPKMLSYEFTGISKEGESPNTTSKRANLYKRYLPYIFNLNDWKIDYSKGNTVVVNRRKS